MSENSYEIGYKRPPKATQWKKGQSGNPRGRAAGQRNLKTELLEEISEIIPIREGGARKKVSKLRALIKAQIAKAIQGDSRATALLLSLLRALDPPPADQATPEPELSETDRKIIEEFAKRQSERNGEEQ
jgi:hypothetical protein